MHWTFVVLLILTIIVILLWGLFIGKIIENNNINLKIMLSITLGCVLTHVFTTFYIGYYFIKYVECKKFIRTVKL